MRTQQVRRQREWIRSSLRTMGSASDEGRKAPRPIDGSVGQGDSNPPLARRSGTSLILEVTQAPTGPYSSSAGSQSFEAGSRSMSRQARFRALTDARTWGSAMTPWIVNAINRFGMEIR